MKRLIPFLISFLAVVNVSASTVSITGRADSAVAAAGKKVIIAHLNADTTIGDTASITGGRFGRLHLPSGSVMYWDGTDVTLTHSANTLTVAGGVFNAALNGTIGATTPASVAATTITASSTLDVLTAINFKLGSVAYTGTMANLNTLRDDSMADALHRHSELSASDGTPNPAVQVDAVGNVGIGVTPGAWRLNYRGLQLGLATFAGYGTQAATAETMIGNNWIYVDGALTNQYIITDEASLYEQAGGIHTFKVAASGTGGTAITWTTALTIANSGAATFAGTVAGAFNGTLGATTPAAGMFTDITGALLNLTNSSAAYKTGYSSPSIYGSSAAGGAYPFLEAGNLIISPRILGALKNVIISTNGTSANFTVDRSGNVGIGVTPEAYHSSMTGLQVGGTGVVFGHTSQGASVSIYLAQNCYFSTDATIDYIVTDEASYYVQNGGTHKFVVAVSGTADAALTTPITALAIENDGDVVLPDNGNVKWGAGADLVALSDGTNGIIYSTAGNVYVGGATVGIMNGARTEWQAAFIANGAVTLYYDNAAKLATSATGVTVTGDINPSAAYTYDLGSVATPMDSLFAQHSLVVGDIPFLDTLHPSDLAQIRAIRGSGVIDPVTGLELVDDNTLPKVMMVTHRKAWVETVVTNIVTRIDTIVTEREEIKRIERDTLVAELDSLLDTTWVAQLVKDSTVVTLSDTALAEVFVSADTALVPHKKGDLVLSSSGKPFYSISPTVGITQGAIRELADKVDSLEARTDAQDVLIANLLSRVTKLEGR